MGVATDIRAGMVITEGNDLFVVTKYYHRTPGNLRGFIQASLKNLKTGATVERRLRPGDKVEIASLESRELEYLYPQGDAFCFMDTETYEQFFIEKDLVGESIPYLRLNDRVRAQVYEGKPVSVELPASVVLKIVETEPGVRGDSATNVFKSAKLETGLTVKVPLFVNQGEHVKVDTRSGEFLERADQPK